MANKTLHSARAQKNDEFYTQLSDINNELKHYRDQLRDKVVFCNCDDPYESNFFRYFALNFNKLGLKQLITTSFKPSPVANTQLGLFGDDKTVETPKGRPKTTANKFIINEVGDIDGDGAFDLRDIAEQLKRNENNEWTPLEGDGDFRSDECVELLKQADVVVTNPPFSLFRDYVAQLVEHNKKFLVIGSKNAITYKEIFKLIKENKLWLGHGFVSGNAYFAIPSQTARDFASGVYDEKTGLVKFRNVGWFTNMDFEERHEDIPLFKKYTSEEYPKYDNYDAIEVSRVINIPVDYFGPMGVPITFLDRYNPNQFDIIWTTDRGGDGYLDSIKLPHTRYDAPVVDGKGLYKRIIIKRKVAQ